MRGSQVVNPSRRPRNNPLAFYERFEVVETLFQALAVPAGKAALLVAMTATGLVGIAAAPNGA
jgi:hypothetical protein